MKLTLALTRACPLACSYCYAEKGPGRMTRKVARAAVDLGLRKATHGVLFLSFFGGEALLEKDLLTDLLEDASKMAERRGKKVFFQLTTSGVGLDEEFAYSLAAHRCDVTVSLDGPADVHDRSRPLRSGRGSHALAMAAAQRLRTAGVSVAANAVVHPTTVSRLPETLAFLREQGFRRIALSPDYTTPWSARDIWNWHVGLARAAGHLTEAIQSREALVIDPISTAMRRRMEWWWRGHSRCGFGVRELAVAPSGEIYPCDRLVARKDGPRWAIGHVLGGGIDRRRRDHLRKETRRQRGKCRGCPIRAICTRTCGGSNIIATGDPGEPSAAFCALEKATASVADALLGRNKQRVPRGTSIPEYS